MIPGKKVPARPYLPFDVDKGELTPSAERGVLDVLDAYIQKLSDE